MAVDNYEEVMQTAYDSIEEDRETVKEGMLICEDAITSLEIAHKEAMPEPLWETCWYEGEVCCLFADSNCGKSILAYQIADEISHKHRVLYFDFELSRKQFELRYTDDAHGLYPFRNFKRAMLDPFRVEMEGFEEKLMKNIESLALKSKAEVLIVDNISYLCVNQEKGDQAGHLMQSLIALKQKYNFSLLVIAHTPKRPMTSPLSQNDLAGSKKLFNFVDSCFAISFCAGRPGYRYIKQLKNRYGQTKWSTHSVMVCKLEKINNFLGFTQIGMEEEKDQLKTSGRSTNDMADERKIAIIDLYNKEVKPKIIGKQLKCNLSYVYRVINDYKNEGGDSTNSTDDYTKIVE